MPKIIRPHNGVRVISVFPKSQCHWRCTPSAFRSLLPTQKNCSESLNCNSLFLSTRLKQNNPQIMPKIIKLNNLGFRFDLLTTSILFYFSHPSIVRSWLIAVRSVTKAMMQIMIRSKHGIFCTLPFVFVIL